MRTFTRTRYGVGGFDPLKPNNNVIDEVIVNLPDDNGETLHAQAMTAMANNRAFLAIVPPLTNAQVVAQVNALTRQINGVMRLLLNQLDGTD